MPVTKRNLRGLRNIRTHSGSDGEADQSHRAYMKLACLEMERARRVMERKNAVRRLKTIDDRILGIEAEEATLRCQLGGAAGATTAAVPTGKGASGAARHKKPGFKVKY